MIQLRSTCRLLSFPVLWMGFVQLSFGLLSFLIFHDRVALAFMLPALAILIACLWLQFHLRNISINQISFRESLAFATLTWLLLGLLAAIPIMLVTGVSLTDGMFESVSAMTTTGATILTGLDEMPKSFLLYRQFLQWMGGLGIVIFIVAILPMLNVGGMRLLKAETPGPVKSDKIAPRIASTTRYLWLVYSSMTLLCALCYWLAGMSPFDAIAHSFTTVSTGGFSPYDASMGHFDSHLILAVANVFMIAGAVSFAVHFQVVYRHNLRPYWQDEETRHFIFALLAISTFLAIYLAETSTHSSGWESLSQAIFHTISFTTSTGYGADDLSSWPAATAGILIAASYLGGCAGSTAGGNKFIRNIIVWRVIKQQLTQAIHPRAMLHVKYQGNAVKNDVLLAVLTFIILVALSTLIFTILLMMTGLDFFSAFSAVSACLNVLGPGFGEVGSNFIPVSDTGSWILVGAMILGRLEYFTVLALLLPKFWRF